MIRVDVICNTCGPLKGFEWEEGDDDDGGIDFYEIARHIQLGHEVTLK